MEILRFGFSICVLLLIISCSYNARVPELIANRGDLSVKERHPYNVSVAVIGGDETFVSSEIFANALVTSLNDSKVFTNASMTQTPGSLDLVVLILSAIHGGLGFNHIMTSKWILKDVDDNEIWSSTVEAKGYSSNFSGILRYRNSAEGAARAVIIEGISKLSSLDL